MSDENICFKGLQPEVAPKKPPKISQRLHELPRRNLCVGGMLTQLFCCKFGVQILRWRSFCELQGEACGNDCRVMNAVMSPSAKSYSRARRPSTSVADPALAFLFGHPMSRSEKDFPQNSQGWRGQRDPGCHCWQRLQSLPCRVAGAPEVSRNNGEEVLKQLLEWYAGICTVCFHLAAGLCRPYVSYSLNCCQGF